MPTTPPPKAFLSYSWESEDHKSWVRSLAERITQNGIEVRLDQWHIVPGQSLTQFMEVEVAKCEFVLVVCTKDYAHKAFNRTGGVGYEQQIITGSIVGGRPRETFIPIVRDGVFNPGPDCSVPGPFQGIYAVDMRDGANLDASIEALLRALYRLPPYTPPALGPRPAFAAQGTEGRADDSQPEVVRLAVREIEGWHLRSGVASHHRWPETFEIPDESERRSLDDRDIVKLMFDIEVPDDPELGDVSSERMWVIVRGRSGPYYLGELNNVPACSDEQDRLKAGDRVVFLPEHVISIYSRGGTEVHFDDGDT